MPEKQNVEWKERWKDEYLKWICGFANAQGGTIYIGKNDNGEVVGINNAKKLLEDLPNKIKNGMGLVVDIDLKIEDKMEYLTITVPQYTFPISYNGKYHYRSGSTIQELTGYALDEFMLRKQGINWDGVPVPGESVGTLDQSAIKLFRKKAMESGRLDSKALAVNDEILFRNLRLFEGNYLKRAAVLLFHEDPEQWIQGAYIKIGFFGKSDSELIYQDEIHGPIIRQVDETVDMVYNKYLKALIDYDGIQRIETYMLPKEAFREILLNAVNHKDYSRGVPIQISVYDDKIYIWNDGRFPDTITENNIYEKHSSIPFNPKIADTLFKAGMIESWGRGFDKIKEECRKSKNPLPEYTLSERGVMVLCRPNKKYQQLAERYLHTQENDKNIDKKNDRKNDKKNDKKKLIETNFSKKKQERILSIIESITQNSSITMQGLARELHVSESTIVRDLEKLRKLGMIERDGSRTKGIWKVL